MFARVQTVNQPAARLDQLTELAREQLPGAHALTGFQGLFYLINRDAEKALVITFWATEADLRQLEANNAAVREHVRAEARLEPPASEVYEVTLRASGPPPD